MLLCRVTILAAGLALVFGAAAGLSRPPSAPPPARAEAPRGKPAPAVGGPVQPEALPLVGHKGAVHAVAFALGGKAVATAGADRTVRVWDPATGRQLHKLDQPGAAVGVAFAPDGKTLAATSTGRTGAVILWDVGTGKQLWRNNLGMTGAGRGIAFSPDGRLVVAGFGDVIGTFGASSGKIFSLTKGPRRETLAVAFSPDGKSLVVGDDGGTVQLLDAATGRPLLNRRGKRAVTALAFRRDGARVAVADGGKAIRILDVNTGKEELAFKGMEGVGALAFSADGKRVATAGAGGSIVLWDAAGKEERRFFARGAVTALAFSPDGWRLATAGPDGALVWDLLRDEKPLPRGLKLTEKQLGSLWTDLASGKGGKVYAASRLLRADPARSVPFLRQRLEPKAAGPDRKRLAQLIADLDADEFTTREAATQALAKLGGAAESALRRALAGRPSPETRVRLERLLKPLGRDKALTAAQQRDVWAVRVLEQVGTPEARKLLNALSKKSADWWVTQEAKEALLRLARRDRKP